MTAKTQTKTNSPARQSYALGVDADELKLNKHKVYAFDVVNTVIMILLTVVFLIPFWMIVATSLSTNSELLQHGAGIVIRGFTLEGYKFLFQASDIFLRSLVNSVVVSFVSAVLSVFICTLAAYALSVKSLPGRKILNVYFMIPMFFGGGTIPTYLVIRAIGIYNTIWALILPGVAGSYYIVLMRNFFYSVSPALSEAARIDGAGYFTITRKIFIPLAVPMMLTIGLIHFVGKWNDYMSSLLYLDTNNKNLWMSQYVLQQMLTQIQSVFGNSVSGSSSTAPIMATKNAGMVIVILPLIAMSPILQKYYVRGLMEGAVKG